MFNPQKNTADGNRSDGRLDVVVFEVAGIRYGVPVAQVQEIARAVTIVPLPQAPPIIEGVINVRGGLVPVLDIRTRFRLPAKVASHTDHLVIAWAGRRLVALRVDRAAGLASMAANAIEAIDALVPRSEYVAGVAKIPDGLVLIHDLGTFLRESEAAVLDEAISATASQVGAP